MLKAFDHIAMPMEKVELMIAFYEALGCKILDQGQIKAVVFGDNKINFHLPDLWNDQEFTLRGHTARQDQVIFVLRGTELKRNYTNT